ncbi:phosphoglucosamine mutase [Candidatus Nomurabacteria bacterium]|nr:phosphoglucosamine mutase [Candidatus Nomurabacteria bacterium]
MSKLNVSGYRGIWGQDLNEKIAFEYGLAFARLIKSQQPTKKCKILIGRDARKTGPQILEAFRQAFAKEKIDFEYAGIIPTPSILLLVKKLSFDGGVMITASHNPPEYNGMKFINNAGLFATQDEIEKIINLLPLQEKNQVVNLEVLPKEFENEKYRKIHIDEILENVDIEKIKSKKFKIAHDPINSAGSVITMELLQNLGCEVFQINENQNGDFAHIPEPIAQNLGQLSEAVIKNKTDIGFAQDPDADRLVMVNEKGEILNEEYTLALAIKNILQKNSKEKNAVVINMSTSNISADIAKENNAEIFRTKIGEANVVNKMKEINAIIGGEGSGGVIYPKINTARDSLVGIALTLELMANLNKSISEIINEFPKYFIKKDKIAFTGELNLIYEKMKKTFENAEINTLDGLRFDWNDSSWLHIRPSNTEPIIRIFCEAKSQKRIDTILEQIKLTLSEQ